ncbi:DUF488 family protein [Leptospira sp. 'Mane']|uniref:DUF488 domain-containing protein n=1 Tax=Leptospira sp. 'Mane' TaxID=3387407 RepID=UPI00398B1FAF
MENSLFTVGHSNHTIEHFKSILIRHQIDVICDVRSNPYSKYNPQFNKEFLKNELKKSNIKYLFLGKELGARSDKKKYYINNKVKYSLLVKDPLFKIGIKRLEDGMKQYKIALMCAEKDPITCHRMILIIREIREKSSIQHILENGTLENNSEAESRLMNLHGLEINLFQQNNQLVEQAYDLQADKIAYELNEGISHLKSV